MGTVGCRSISVIYICTVYICIFFGWGVRLPSHRKVLPSAPPPTATAAAAAAAAATGATIPLMPDKMDWTALVDTATKAINTKDGGTRQR